MGTKRTLGLGVSLLLAAACAPGTVRTVEEAKAPAEARSEVFSPQSAALLFTSNHEGNSEVYLRPAGSSAAVNLTRDPAGDNWPEWSPDGRRIAFQSRRSGNLDIWVMAADGTGPTRLTDDAEPDYLPSWSADGGSITFTSWRREAGDAERSSHIYLMNADGSGERRLVAEALGTSAGAAWAPDGQSFIFSRQTEGENVDLFVADAAGGNERRLTRGGAYLGSAVFSPDGRTIAYYAVDADDRSDLVVARADGTEPRVVLRGGQAWYPRFSPDGRWLLYTAAPEGGVEGDLDILAVPTDGSGEPVLVAGGPGRQSEGRWR